MILLLAKVPKKGVFAVSAEIQGILFLLVGGFWTIPVALIIGGLYPRQYDELYALCPYSAGIRVLSGPAAWLDCRSCDTACVTWCKGNE